MPAPRRRLRQASSPTASASDAATGAAPGAGPPNHRPCDRPQSRLAAVGRRHRQYRQRPGARRQNRRPPAAPAALPWRTRRDGSVGKQRVATSDVRREAGQADSSVRPLRRRAAMMARPARVRMRKRNPWVLARRRLFGWNVRLPLVTTVGLPVLGARPHPSGLRRRDCRVVRLSPTDPGGTITSGSHLACGPERTGGARARKNARRWREMGLSLGGGPGRRQNLRPPSLSGRHAVTSVMLAYTGFLWQHLVIAVRIGST
jgi:hypothetical protein